MRLHHLLLVVASLVATPALAQRIIFVPPTMSAPVAVSPGSGVRTHDFIVPATAFVWDQHPFIAGPGTRLPTHFIWCLRKVGESACGHANALLNSLPGGIPSSIIRAPANFTPVGTRYTHRPTIPADRLDTNVYWQVGACITNDDTSCAFSGLTWITLATMELQAVAISAGPFGDQYQVIGYARNQGTRASRPVKAQLDTWEAVYDAGTDDCLKNLNDPSVTNDATVYVSDIRGSKTRLVDIPRNAAGKRIMAGVIGMFRLNSNHWNSPVFSGLTFAPTAGMMNPPRTSIGSYDINVPEDTYPRAFLHTQLVDYPGVIDEVDENNNSVAECDVLR